VYERGYIDDVGGVVTYRLRGEEMHQKAYLSIVRRMQLLQGDCRSSFLLTLPQPICPVK